MPKEFHKSLMSGMLGSEAIGHLVYMSSSAHPAALLAGRDMKMNAHCLLPCVREHSRAHGQLLLWMPVRFRR